MKLKKTAGIPADFRKALVSHKHASMIFEHLPPSHKRAYVDTIVEAKKPETRLRRIEQALVVLAIVKK